MSPVDENWPIFKVSKIIGKFSSYEEALSAEKSAVFSSEYILDRGPGKRKIKANFIHSPPPKEETQGEKREDIITGEDLISSYLPLKDIAELLHFDNLIQSNEEAFKQLVQKYLQFGGKNNSDFLRRILSLTFTNSVANVCSWTGQKNNFRVKDTTVIKIMRGAVRKVYPEFSECAFDKVAMDWFRHSKQRLLRETKN